MRLLPDGGMVVIAADGRKLWFSADEVTAAREKLAGQSKPQKSSLPPVKLNKMPGAIPTVHNGIPLRTSITKDLKVKHDHSHNP
jgi:hypothetical protein